jgi:AraC family transcriptional regulator
MAERNVVPIRSVRRCGSAILTHTVYPGSHRLRSHVHEAGCFGITLQGIFKESFGSNTIERLPHSVFYRPPGERHSNATGECQTTCFVLEFPSSWVDHVSQHGRLPNIPRLYRHPKLTRIMQDLYRESQMTDGASTLAVQPLHLELAATVIREAAHDRGQGRIQPWLSHTKERLDDYFRENITLAELAEDAGVHPVHLAREFRSKFSMPVGEYVRRRRIEAAMVALRRRELPLVTIALETGFSSQGHFSDVFRQITGQTPFQYRLAHR